MWKKFFTSLIPFFKLAGVFQNPFSVWYTSSIICKKPPIRRVYPKEIILLSDKSLEKIIYKTIERLRIIGKDAVIANLFL